MPKPKGKAGPSKGHNKNFKRRSAGKSTYDYIPESAIDREPGGEEQEDDNSTSPRIKIDVPVAMWVCKTALHCVPRDLLREFRTSDIATQNAARGRSLLV